MFECRSDLCRFWFAVLDDVDYHKAHFQQPREPENHTGEHFQCLQD